MSRYQPSLRELAMEPDEDKRLEMAAAIDEDAAELDDRWDEREGWRNEREEWDAERDRLNAERDEAIAERDRYREERDESRRRYADRFFAVQNLRHNLRWLVLRSPALPPDHRRHLPARLPYLRSR